MDYTNGGSWRTAGALPSTRYGLKAASIDGQLYVSHLSSSLLCWFLLFCPHRSSTMCAQSMVPDEWELTLMEFTAVDGGSISKKGMVAPESTGNKLTVLILIDVVVLISNSSVDCSNSY